MRISINTSIDVSESEMQELYKHFNEEQFEIKNIIFKPGANVTTMVVEFLLSAVVGGFIYDQVKFGIKKITNKNKVENSRKIIFKILLNDSTYIVEDKAAKQLDENGTLVPIGSVDELFELIKNEDLKT